MLTTIKVNAACYAVNIYKNNHFFKRGGGRRSWTHLREIRNYFILFPIFYAWFMACVQNQTFVLNM